jgi:uncharacterized protein YtpQ (UPF0354 family)
MSNSAQSRAPAWARMLGDSGFQTFTRQVQAYFDARDIRIVYDTDAGVVTPQSGALGRGSTLGLQNVAQKCGRADRDLWQSIIAEHFDVLFDTSANAADAVAIEHLSYEVARSHIRARLYPEDALKKIPTLMQRPLVEGLLEALVLDMPKSVRTLTRSEALRWGISEDELFMVGRQNLGASGFLDETKASLPSNAMHMLSGDAFYAASHLLVFERYVTEPMPHGMVVSVPKRDVILAHYIRNIGVLEAISGMLEVTVGMYEEGPGSLSPNLYWYRNGAFSNLAYTLSGGSFSLLPSSDFSDLLHGLSSTAQLS